jgi:hypothetical protein
MKRVVLLTFFAAMLAGPAVAQRTVEWRGWTAVECYPGLDFRIGHTGPPLPDGYYLLHAQFRNRYRASIYFDYVVREPGTDTPVEFRVLDGIDPRGIGPVTEFVGDFSPEFYLQIAPAEPAEVVVDNVNMETDMGRRLAPQPGCNPAVVSESAVPPRTRLRNPIRARTERTHDLTSSKIFMYSESDETLTVEVILFDCENIRNPCDVPILFDGRLDPGEETQVLVVRPRNRNRAWSFRYRFTWSRLP